MWADRSAALGGGLTCGEGIAVGGEVGPGPVAAAIACGQAGVQQGDSGGQVAGAGHRAGAAVHQPWFDQTEPVGERGEMDRTGAPRVSRSRTWRAAYVEAGRVEHCA